MKKAFSLIELMVVIAIVALLATVATPSYVNYVKKANVAATLPTLQSVADVFVNEYEFSDTGFPASIEFAGVTIADGNTVAVAVQGITDVLYVTNTGDSNIPADVAVLCVNVDVEVASGGTRICKSLDYRGSLVATSLCGQLDGSASDLNVEYLPGGCTSVLVNDL